MTNTLTPHKAPAVLVVGSGNAETVLDLNSDLIMGRKHNVKRLELFGGSGVNYTLRLSTYDGTQVLPILSVGEDDIGTSIQRTILQALDAQPPCAAVHEFAASPDFLCKGLTTAQSTIVNVHQVHTIFREEARGAEHFGATVEKRLIEVQALDGTCVDVGAVMIGHVNADQPGLGPGPGGQITKQIIGCYRDKAIVFTNFGESQYCLGHTFWEDALSGLTAFQLSIIEALEFFGNRCDARDRPIPWSLAEMLGWFQERGVTAVITLDRFGAVATFQGQEGVIFAPAFDLDSFVDSTGAGDAFGSGLVHTLCHANEPLSFDLFQTAIKRARMWAAHACTTRGAASRCPRQDELAAFEARLREKGQDPDTIDCRDLAAWEGIFRILDKAYRAIWDGSGLTI
jgi:sugar/nucleoside kinase (ribokinase family)